MAKKLELKVKVKGTEWTVRLLPSKAYAKENGDDSSGMTHPFKKVIDFHHKHYDITTIIHELVHAYVAECNTESASLSTDQMEELICSIMGECVFDLLATAHKIQLFFQLNS